MLGYIISDKEEINVNDYKIKSFDILHKTDLNIYVVENNKVLYKNNIIVNASINGHVEILEWFKSSGYNFKYDIDVINYALSEGHVKILDWIKNSCYRLRYNRYGITWHV